MHPILKRRSRLVLYLAVWLVFGLLLTVVFIFGGRAPPLWSLYFAVPMAMLLGMQSLSYWYLVQSMPPGETPVVRMAVMWVAVGLASLVAWLAIGYVWAQYLVIRTTGPGDGGGHSRPDDLRRRDRHFARGARPLSVPARFERARILERRELEVQAGAQTPS